MEENRLIIDHFRAIDALQVEQTGAEGVSRDIPPADEDASDEETEDTSATQEEPAEDESVEDEKTETEMTDEQTEAEPPLGFDRLDGRGRRMEHDVGFVIRQDRPDVVA
jgi:hypothetical protein